MYDLTLKGAYLLAIFVRTIDVNQCFIRGPTLPAHFSMSRFLVIFFQARVTVINFAVLIHNVACC